VEVPENVKVIAVPQVGGSHHHYLHHLGIPFREATLTSSLYGVPLPPWEGKLAPPNR
jgi:hypothetical protein